MADAEWSATIVDKIMIHRSSEIDKEQISKNVKIGHFYVGPGVELENVELINVHMKYKGR